jgi:hypothetical protein
MVKLAAICWALGMSYRSVAAVFAVFGIRLAQMSIWRDVQEQEQVQRWQHWGKVRVLGVDGAYVPGWGDKQPVLVCVDLGSGEPVALGYLDEKDPRAVQKFLEPLVQRLGVRLSGHVVEFGNIRTIYHFDNVTLTEAIVVKPTE